MFILTLAPEGGEAPIRMRRAATYPAAAGRAYATAPAERGNALRQWGCWRTERKLRPMPKHVEMTLFHCWASARDGQGVERG